MKYNIKKYEQSPFNKDSIGKDMFVLCVGDKPFAEIDDKLPWFLKEGDEVDGKDIEVRTVGKKSKHLVVGDAVMIGYYCEGIIEKIVENEFGYWEDEFHLKGCKVGNPDCNPDFLDDGAIIKPDEKMVGLRKDHPAKQWFVATIKPSDESLWLIIEKELNEISNKKEIFEFIKNRTEIKKY